MNKTKLLRTTFAIGVLTALALSPAHATPVGTTATSTFTQSNLFPAAQVQNWGTLDTSCNGTTCTVSLTPNGDTFFGQEFLGFDLNSGASNLTLSSTILAHSGTFATGSFNLDGFGFFNDLISLQDGPGNGFSSTVTVFTVDYTGAASTLFVLNGSGFDAAGHVLISGTQCTGYVGEGTGTNDGSSQNCGTPPTDTPEPAALTLLGLGLLALSAMRLRKRT